MVPLLYSLEFRGTATALSPRVLEARATAAAGRLVTSSEEEARLESRIVVDDYGTLHVSGRILVGPGNVLRFRTLGTGRLASSPDPHLRQGALVCEVVAGEGRFAGVSGRIASTLLLSDSGDLTENQLGVLFTKGVPHAR